jgi:hypothetical protein
MSEVTLTVPDASGEVVEKVVDLTVQEQLPDPVPPDETAESEQEPAGSDESTVAPVEPDETPISALNANVVQEWKTLENLSDGNKRVAVREIRIHEMSGKYPTVDTYPSVDTGLLTQGDANPFYLVLPIARSGETSSNHLDYDEALVESVAEQLQGLGGIRGHIPEDQASTAFPIEDVDWVGHLRQGNTLWAKGYIPPGETREYIRRIKARNGKLSTSIYGTGLVGETSKGGRRLIDFSLQQVDLAPAKKASLKLGGDFAIVSEMTNGEQTMPITKEVLAELSVSDLYDLLDEGMADQIAQMYAKKKNKKVVAAEMVADPERVAEFDTVTTERDRLLRENRKQAERIAEFELVEFEAGLQGVIDGAFAGWQNLDKLNAKQQQQFNSVKAQLQSRVIAELDGRQDIALAKAKRDAVMESDEFRPVVEMMRDAFTGGSVIAGGEGNNARKSLYERAEQLAQEVGVSNG